MKSFWGVIQKQAKDRASSLFGSGGVGSPTGGDRPSTPPGDGTSTEDPPLRNEVLEEALKTRSRGIQRHIACLNPDSYSETKELRVWAGTYNVNGERPHAEQDYRSWMFHPGDKWPQRSGDMAAWEGPDIVVVGLEEVNALNAVTVMAGASLDSANAWNACIDCALNCKPLPEGYTAGQAAIDGLTGFTGEESPRHRSVGFGVVDVKDSPELHEQYANVGGRMLVGLFVTVWVRKPLLPHISSWQASDVRTGAMGFGNKGCVMVRMRVFDEPLCCMCAHLASGESAADALRRQADFMQVCRSGAFSGDEAPGGQIQHEPLEHDVTEGTWARSELASAQPTVILVGDFNFRMQGISDAEVRNLLRVGGLDRLIARDELTAAMDSSDGAGVFTGWREGFLAFMPTFKYVKGTDRYIGDVQAEGLESVASVGAGRTLSGWSDGGAPVVDAPSLAASSAATEPPSQPPTSAAAADTEASTDTGAATATAPGDAEEATTDATPPVDTTGTRASPQPPPAAVGSHILNLSDESDGGGASPTAGTPVPPAATEGGSSEGAAAELDVEAKTSQATTPVAASTFADASPVAANSKNGSVSFASVAGATAALTRPVGLLYSRQNSVTSSSGAQSTGVLPGARERVRTPAWTDRVLYRCEKEGTLCQLLYDRFEITGSDHKPVMSAFLFNAQQIDAERLQAEVEAAQKALDLVANNAQPRCTVSENLLEVGELSYGEIAVRTCSLSCVGEVPAEWRITAPPAPDGSEATGEVLPAWVTMSPQAGMLTPGQTVDISFRIGVPDALAATGADPAIAERVVRRPDAPSSLSHMFVLRIDNGADHFVLIEGTYKPSFFGLTISTLEEREAHQDPETLDECKCVGDGMKYILASPFVNHQWSAIPQPIKRMLHFLARDSCLATPGIFSESFQMIRSEAQAEEVSTALVTEQPGRLPAVVAVQAALDAGAPFPASCTAHDVAATMLSYFKALPQPFFPESISAVCTQTRPNANIAATTLKEALGGGAEWAVLCCTMRLLKLAIKAQVEAGGKEGGSTPAESPDKATKATFGGKAPSASQRRAAIRSQLASCFADVWFPAISLQDLDENATADDYAMLLQKAADASAKQAQFLQMFLT